MPLSAMTPPSTKSTPMFLPRWFRALVIVLATVILCACQSTSPTAPHPRVGGYSQVGAEHGAVPTLPVQQAQFASQQWVDSVATQPYHGEVTPCSCHGCESSSTAQNPYAVEDPYPAHDPNMMDCPTGDCGGCHSCAVIGPTDEYLCDGGDFQTPAGVRHDWQVEGVEQEDTISHYDTLDGRVIVKPSNRVCIYAPRFNAVRRVENLVVNNHRVGPGGIIDEMGLVAAGRVDEATTSLEQLAPIASLGDQPANLFRARVQAGAIRTRLAAADLETFLAPQMALEVVKVGIIDNSEKPRLAKAIVSAYQWASDVSAQVTIDGKQAAPSKSDAPKPAKFLGSNYPTRHKSASSSWRRRAPRLLAKK